MHRRSRLRLAALAAVLAAPLGALGASPAPAASGPVVHPDKWPAARSRGLIDPATESRIDGLIAGMSLEEKVGQLIQADITAIKPEDLRRYPLGSILAGGNSGPGNDDRAQAQAWLDLVHAFQAVALERRPGHSPIPLMFGIDAVHGHANVPGATVFPHNIGLGAAHDPDLIRRIGQATAEEVAVTGWDWSFGPTLAVPRDDRWGRTYEGYSEDPEIVKAYAGPMVEGLQGRPSQWPTLQHGRVAASLKHFLGDGGTEGGHDQGDDKISEDELIAVHAPGYPPAIDAGALTVLVSFSSWQGEKMTGDKALLTDVLKGRMGFEGLVVSDWNAHLQVPGCRADSCAAAINAGLDMFMAPDTWKGLYANTLAQARSGEIPAARLDDAVRRILRVKLKEGLFDPARPYEGRFDQLGSPDHRAVAREAVRKSLVLLKNDGVLPIRGSARVLVAGDGADDIGKQSGGWTISWQGTGNRNSDFPHGQSIWGGIEEAVKAAGGTAELSPSGEFTTRPDVAVVVFGENPYAEFQGDRPTLEYQPGDKTDLALLRKLKARGVPVVSVFLSGRPMWVNPELNASDAFVAAWLPGSEGGGVADVLVGDGAGKPRNDFTGRLSFSWPKNAAAVPLNRGDAHYDPLFAYGFGLTYADHVRLARLSEAPGVKSVAVAGDLFFAAGREVAPWKLVVSGGAAMHASDAEGVQEKGREVVWSGQGEASFAVTGPETDLSRQTNGDMAVAVRMKVEQAPSAQVTLSLGCGDKCQASLDASKLFATPGEWRTVKIKLSCFRSRGADVAKVTSPIGITTAGRMTLSISELKLAANTGDAICPEG
jgi:beta-glucosidase